MKYKKTIIIIILSILAISVAVSLYFSESKRLETERQEYLGLVKLYSDLNELLTKRRLQYFNTGALQMRELIFNVVRQEGQVLIGNIAGEQILLEIKK